MSSSIKLLEWKRSLSVEIPGNSDAKPKNVRFNSKNLNLPSELVAESIWGQPTTRSQSAGATSIEAALITAERESFSALGLLFIAYALSEQKAPFRLQLSGSGDALSQLVIWPNIASSLEAHLGFKQTVQEVHYRPKLPVGNPNYTTDEQDDPDYPREHLPYCRLGAFDVEGGGVVRKNEAVCIHFRGTGPSLVWLGKYLLNFGLSDNNAMLAYLYNLPPNESMAPLSGELRLTVANTGQPEMFPAG